MKYECKLSGMSAWRGKLKVLGYRSSDQLELDISGRGTQFHVIVGTHQNGRYLCIPNHGIGCELSSLGDWYWNWEQLRRFLGKVDACTVASGLYELEGI